MLEREFGSAAVKVPVVRQGTWNMERDGLEALRTGIELGMTHIDTAELYTGAEEVIAEAIRGIRRNIFLVSKVLPSNASYNLNPAHSTVGDDSDRAVSSARG